MSAHWLYKLSVILPPAILAITLHEAAHGWVAWRLGDGTAYRLGRVSFNPLRHVDPVGTLLLPALLYLSGGFLFGWAKPVPVNFRALNHPRRDMVLVALAGPGINILLALLSAWAFTQAAHFPREVREWAYPVLVVSVQLNVVLAVFNMLPLPPLDGGRVAVGVLPRWLARPLARLEPYGIGVLLGVIFLLPLIGRQTGMDLDVLPRLLGPAVDWVIERIVALVGAG